MDERPDPVNREELPPPLRQDQGLEGDVSAAGIKRAYVRVVVVWLAVLAALWWLQHAFI